MMALFRNPDAPHARHPPHVVTEPAFGASAPRMLFEGPYEGTGPIRSFDVSRDGMFVLMQPRPEEPEPVTNIRVVLNWFEELKRLAPVR
jgi:hypothetical protein